MEEEKRDKAWLEAKWWYRLVKVFYIGFFLIVTIATAFGIFDDRPHSYGYDGDKSIITCSNGKKGSLNETGVFISVSTEYDRQKVRNFCFGD